MKRLQVRAKHRLRLTNRHDGQAASERERVLASLRGIAPDAFTTRVADDRELSLDDGISDLVGHPCEHHAAARTPETSEPGAASPSTANAPQNAGCCQRSSWRMRPELLDNAVATSSPAPSRS